MLILLVYVDDNMFTGNNFAAVSKLVSDLNCNFVLKDLGSLHFFLGVEAFRDTTELYLTQTKYVVDLLKRTKMDEAKPLTFPATLGKILSKRDGDLMVEPVLYRNIIGALQYVTMTRPDISYMVSKLSQFLQNPIDVHWKACKRVLCYLKGTITHGLHFKSSKQLDLVGFSNADWASCPNDRRSTSGYCVFFWRKSCILEF